MGLFLSLLVLPRKANIKRKIFHSESDDNTVMVKSISSNVKDAETTSRSVSFKKADAETKLTLDGSGENLSIEESISFKSREVDKVKFETRLPFMNEGLENETLGSITLTSTDNEDVLKSKPASYLPKLSSPRLKSELDAAALQLQKFYRSYRTRRILADCAVVVEELWWKALDFAALKRSSVSFFDVRKPETAVSRWARARTMAAKVGKGLSKDEKAQKLALRHWLEAIDPRHRYGHNLHLYYDVWFGSESTEPFFYWLDIGEGKGVDLEKCSRIDLQWQCIKYLGPNEREAYEVIIDDGKLVYKKSGMFVDTCEGSKWIFVLSTSRALYAGQKKKGTFQHSSFLSGGATTASGRMVAENGILKAIWPYSGHYCPTEENFKEFISFLGEHNVDLTNVKRCAIDDDSPPFKIVSEEELHREEAAERRTMAEVVNVAMAKVDESATETSEVARTNAHKDVDHVEEPAFHLVKPLSCKWSTGVGPRIGCVRDYPTELQFRALEKVNLSPRVVTTAPTGNFGPIPSPRPSPKVKVSPRLAYMGLPSPRVALSTPPKLSLFTPK
ncbi:hypothetical protein AAC387_Pa05g2247 [Persea americana]